MTVLDDLAIPLIGAPMAGGPSTDDLVVSVSGCGGLGVLATAYRTPDSVRASISAVRDRGVRTFGANLFVPDPVDRHRVDDDALSRYRRTLGPAADALGVEPGTVETEYSTRAYDDLLDVIVAERVPLVSFTFGLPGVDAVERLHAGGAAVVVTVTSVDDARSAVDRGADVVWAQGPEAGGHRSTFTVTETPPDTPGAALVAVVSDAVAVPVIASGGVGSGADAAALLDAGARAVAVGTLLLRTPEAGTSAPYRRALADHDAPDTVTTRAFSGRVARGIANRFHREFADAAPSLFPEVNTVTSPLRRAATAADDPGGITLWAGTGFRSARDAPAATVIADLWRDCRAVRDR